MNYIYPDDLSNFRVGTKYQIRDAFGSWGQTLILKKFCKSVQDNLLYYIYNCRLRVVAY